MQLMSSERAREMVASFKDCLGKPVDYGIAEPLAQFVRVAKALGFETTRSCEGHIDWGTPYPQIEFNVPHGPLPITPIWKFWFRRRRLFEIRRQERHKSNAESKTGQLCSTLTKLLVQYYAVHGTSAEAMLHVERGGLFRFRLVPVHTHLSEGYKASGDFILLSTLLEGQRLVFNSFSFFVVEALERNNDFAGRPEDGYKGYMGRR